jgi:hypothetical protein
MGFLRVYHRTVSLSSRAFLRYRDSLSIHTGYPPEHPNEGHLQDLISGYRDDPAGHDPAHENCHYQKRARKVRDRSLPKLRMPG